MVETGLLYEIVDHRILERKEKDNYTTLLLTLSLDASDQKELPHHLLLKFQDHEALALWLATALSPLVGGDWRKVTEMLDKKQHPDRTKPQQS